MIAVSRLASHTIINVAFYSKLLCTHCLRFISVVSLLSSVPNFMNCLHTVNFKNCTMHTVNFLELPRCVTAGALCDGFCGLLGPLARSCVSG